MSKQNEICPAQEGEVMPWAAGDGREPIGGPFGVRIEICDSRVNSLAEINRLSISAVRYLVRF